MMQVQRSGYYAWRERGESTRAVEDRRLAVEVRTAFVENKRRYGSVRVRRALLNKGQRICRHRIARLMREQQLRARPRRKFVATTNSDHSQPVPENVLQREFEAAAPNRAWVGDVTYLPTREGWLFLAVLLDLYSRRVIGFAMSERNDEALTLSALRMALEQRRPKPGLIHHTDRGTTYASGAYRELLAQHGVVCSMSRRGNCWDNAVAESFFSTLDVECARGEVFASRADARREVLEYILRFYNPTRLHSFLGYRSPMEFERAA